LGFAQQEPKTFESTPFSASIRSASSGQSTRTIAFVN